MESTGCGAPALSRTRKGMPSSFQDGPCQKFEPPYLPLKILGNSLEQCRHLPSHGKSHNPVPRVNLFSKSHHPHDFESLTAERPLATASELIIRLTSSITTNISPNRLLLE